MTGEGHDGGVPRQLAHGVLSRPPGNALPAIVPHLHAHTVEGRLLTARAGEHTQVPEFDGLVLGIRDEVTSISLLVCNYREEVHV